MLSLSVIVPVHYGGRAFRQCLERLMAEQGRRDEIIIVADGKTDGAWRDVASPHVRVLYYESSQGPAYARNRGAEVARNDVLFFVDADVDVAPGTLDRVRQAFAAKDDLDALIGSYDDAPKATGFFSQYRNLLHHYTHQRAEQEAATFWGACGAIRRDVFYDVGGFDERYRRPSVEDIELGYRIRAAGYRIQLCKTLQVKHLKHWDFLSMLRTDVFSRAIPWTRLLLRHRRLDDDLNLRMEHRASVGCVFVLVGAVLLSLWYPAAWLAAAGCGAALLFFNAPFYDLLRRKRGLWFAVKAVPCHWMFYLYGGAAFLVGLVRHVFDSPPHPQPEPALMPVSDSFDHI